MKNVINVLRFEYKGFVSAKSFRVVSIVFVVVIIAATSIPQIAGFFQSLGVGGEGAGDGSKAALILSGEALTNEVYQAAFSEETLEGTGWVNLSKDPPTDEALSDAIKNGEYKFAVRYSGGASYDFLAAGNRIDSYDAIGTISEYITEIAREAEIASLPAETQEIIIRISTITAEPRIIDIGGNASNNFLIGYILIMFMMYVIVGYTNYVSSSVVTEKTSKAMELLITSVKPLHLMVGKVLGVGFAALTQVGILVASVAAGIVINLPYWAKTGNTLYEITQGGNVGASIAAIVIVYFLLGFFLYAFLSAAFASTVTRPEEAATVTILPIMLILAALLIGFLTLFGALGKGVAAALSYIPFFTPISMMARYTLGDAGTPQLVIGAGVMAAAVFVIAVIASKIFRMGVMLYGVKATPKQIWRALRSS